MRLEARALRDKRAVVGVNSRRCPHSQPDNISFAAGGIGAVCGKKARLGVLMKSWVLRPRDVKYLLESHFLRNGRSLAQSRSAAAVN